MSQSEPQPPDASSQSQGQGARPQSLLPVPIPTPSARAEFVTSSGRSTVPDALGFIKALRRRWLLAVTLGVIVGGLAAGGTWLFMPKAKHSAHTWLNVSPTPPRFLGQGNDQQAEFAAFKSSQVALVKSQAVRNAALRDHPDLSCLHAEGVDPTEVLYNLLVVDFKVGPTIMQISMSGEDDGELTVIVNAVADAYMQEVVAKEHDKREAELKEFEGLRNAARSNMKHRQEDLNFSSIMATDPIVVMLERVFLNSQLMAAQQQLVQVKAKLRELNAILEAEQAEENLPIRCARAIGFMYSPMGQGPTLVASAFAPQIAVSDEIADQAMRQDKTLNGLLDRKQKLEMDLHDTKAVFKKPGDQAEVKRLEEELAKLDTKIEEARRVLKGRTLVLQSNSEKRGIASLTNQIRLEKELEKTLKKAVGELTVQVKNATSVGNKDFDYLESRVNAANAEAVFKEADAAVEMLKLNMNAQPRVSRHAERGVVTHGNDLKRRTLSTAGAGVGGFFLILFGVGFIEFRTRKIHSVDEVTSALGIHIVGTLPAPARSNRFARRGANDAYWQNMMTESVDAIRTILLHTARKDDLRIVMVTSAVGGEGKTSLASHLAASLARAGCNTLILDCDLRKPAAHRMFDVERGPGFSELLRGEADLVAVTHATPADNLRVIPAGRCDALALQILAQGGAESTFEELRAKYDYVIVDSAPVLPVADSLLIGQHVDAVVFSILRDISRTPRVYAAYNRLAMLGIRMLGAVVNGTREDSYGPDYHYASMSS